MARKFINEFIKFSYGDHTGKVYLMQQIIYTEQALFTILCHLPLAKQQEIGELVWQKK